MVYKMWLDNLLDMTAARPSQLSIKNSDIKIKFNFSNPRTQNSKAEFINKWRRNNGNTHLQSRANSNLRCDIISAAEDRNIISL